jgi:ubiquitin-activating enzyme E1
MNKLLEEITSVVGKAKEIKEIEFEKDDDQNGHIDFITFYSNFRAENYSINKLPFHEIKIKAGKIIPAIATSTAMICGQVFIEVCKYYLQVPFEQYRNFFANLAINAYSFSEPIGPLV